jgi:outer membrane protein assembly factor BamB
VRRLAYVSILVAASIVAVLLILRWRETRDVRGSTTIEFVAPKPPERKVAKHAETAWVTYGFDSARRRVSPSLLRPPFRREWLFRAKRLLEFPPAVAGGRVYLPVADGRFYALDAAGGRVLWLRRLPRCIWATPALASGLLVLTSINRLGSCNERTEKLGGALTAFRTRDGSIRWNVSLPPTESSPLVVDGVVYVGDWDGWLRAYELTNGQLRWRRLVGGPIKGSVSYADGRLYVGSYDGRLYCFDLSGREFWRSVAQPNLLGSLGSFYSTPTVAYGRVYLGSTGGKIYSFGATSGKLRWSHSTGGYVYASPAVWNGLVFIGSYDGFFYALDAASGALRWRFHSNGRVSGSATVLHGLVYFSTLSERTYALDALSGRLVWSFRDGKYSPIVDDGSRVFLVGYGRLYGLVPAQPKRAADQGTARR